MFANEIDIMRIHTFLLFSILSAKRVKTSYCGPVIWQFRFANGRDKLFIYSGIIMSILSAFANTWSLCLFCSFLQEMVDYATSAATGNADSVAFLARASNFAIYYSSVGTIIIILTYGACVLMNLAAYRQIYRIRQEYLKAALNQDMEYYDTNNAGDFAAKMSDHAVKVENGIGEKLGTFINFQASFASLIILALVLGWKLALLCLSVFPVIMMLIGATGLITAKLSNKETLATSKASIVAEEILSGIRTVYAFSGQQKACEQYKNHLREARKIKTIKAIFLGLTSGLIFFCIFSSYGLAFYFGFNLMLKEPENYDIQTMTAVLMCVISGTASFGVSATLVQAFGRATNAGSFVFFLINNKPKINTLRNAGLVPKSAEGKIELLKVNFYYVSRPDVQVLKNVDLSINSGESVALVGHSGSGKSTIIQLILRLYDVTNGKVLVDGHDVRELSVKWLRGQIGLVGQEPVLFNATILENIRHGRPDAPETDVHAAAREANAHSFIMKLSEGYNTIVGERGASLSGGQKQRIAIARALIRNPRILLLDEATSALDSTAEAEVQHALDKAKEGRTTVIIAHRLTTIKNVDKIYVFSKGEIVESGTHKELLEREGHYYNMVRLQTGVQTDEEDALSAGPIPEPSEISEKLVRNKSEVKFVEHIDEDQKTIHVSYMDILRMNGPELKLLSVACVAAVLSGIAMPLFAVFFGSFLGISASLDKESIENKVRELSLIFLGVGAFSGITNFVMTYLLEASSAYLVERLQSKMFCKLLELEMEFYDNPKNSAGALGATLSGEPTAVEVATGTQIGLTLQAIGTFVFGIIIAMIFEWKVGLIALAFAPIFIATMYKEGRMASEESSGTAKTMKKSSKVAVEAVSNIRTVVPLGRENYFLDVYSRQLRPALQLAERGAHMRGLVFGLSKGIPNYIVSAAFYAGTRFIVYYNAGFDNVFRSTQALMLGMMSVATVIAFTADYHKGIRAMMRIKTLLNKQSKITDPHRPVQKFEAMGQASLENVRFYYSSQPDITVLDNMNLKIERGKTIALVGASGCGKSTVIQLLERYYDPVEGIVALDNIGLKDLHLADARKYIGLVQQEPILFSGTIEENIAYGDNSITFKKEQIIEAAKQANIHNFIVSLPKGYETDLGSKGTQLSGGQKQRIAIARAFIRKPKLLLLDEATSALDVESEKVVQEALDRAKAGRTCFTIAHRLSSIRDADVINVVHKGKVVEQGTHDTLMALKGHYYHLNRH